MMPPCHGRKSRQSILKGTRKICAAGPHCRRGYQRDGSDVYGDLGFELNSSRRGSGLECRLIGLGKVGGFLRVTIHGKQNQLINFIDEDLHSPEQLLAFFMAWTIFQILHQSVELVGQPQEPL
jgi:hypothetical protein